MDQPCRSALRKPKQHSTFPANTSSSIPEPSAPNQVHESTNSPTSSQPQTQPILLPLKDAALQHIKFTIQGIKDAFAWPAALITIYGSKTIQINALKCLILNGIIFLGSILFFDYAILPISRRLWAIAGNNTSGMGILDTLFGLTYYVLWVYPIYAISFLLNAVWYQRIADRAYQLQIGKPVSTPITYDNLLKTLSTELYRALLLVNFLTLSLLMYYIPFIGPTLSFATFCWIASFYSFEYKWVSKGWSLQQRIEHLEERWSYYLGFGLPCTLATFFFPQFISQGLFALLFPMYIIMSNRAKPLPKQGQVFHSKYIPNRLPIFKIAIAANVFCINRLVKRNRSVPVSGRK